MPKQPLSFILVKSKKRKLPTGRVQLHNHFAYIKYFFLMDQPRPPFVHLRSLNTYRTKNITTVNSMIISVKVKLYTAATVGNLFIIFT